MYCTSFPLNNQQFGYGREPCQAVAPSIRHVLWRRRRCPCLWREPRRTIRIFIPPRPRCALRKRHTGTVHELDVKFNKVVRVLKILKIQDDHDDEMTRFYERLSKFIDDYTPDALESSEEWVTLMFLSCGASGYKWAFLSYLGTILKSSKLEVILPIVCMLPKVFQTHSIVIGAIKSNMSCGESTPSLTRMHVTGVA